jgi:hypothetical protein
MAKRPEPVTVADLKAVVLQAIAPRFGERPLDVRPAARR